jgi:hypothetical protein
MLRFDVFLAIVAVLIMWCVAAIAPKCEPMTLEFRLSHTLFAGCIIPR